MNWFLPVGENEISLGLDSLHAIIKMIVAKCLLKSDDAKL
jgi:hypothetical protein